MINQSFKIKSYTKLIQPPKMNKILLNQSNISTISTKAIDKNILSIASSSSLNFLIIPMVGFIDAFWIGRMGNSMMLSSQGTAENIFNFIFNIFFFMSTYITPEISKLNSEKNETEIKNTISICLIVSLNIGIIVYFLTYLLSKKYIFVFMDKSEITRNAVQYLNYRSISIPFAMINSTIFAVLRGMLMFKKALILNINAQLINVILNPLFMKKYGVNGIAIASIISDVFCSIQYFYFLINNKLITLHLKNVKMKISNIFKNGVFIQIRNLSLKIMNILLLRKILKLDKTGTDIASYILANKIIDIGIVGYFGLGTVAYTLVPSNNIEEKYIYKRLFYWTRIYSYIQIIYVAIFSFCIPLISNDLIVIEKTKQKLLFIYSLLTLQGFANNYDGKLLANKKFYIQTGLAFSSMIYAAFLFSISNSINHIWYSLINIYSVRLLFLYFYNFYSK